MTKTTRAPERTSRTASISTLSIGIALIVAAVAICVALVLYLR